MASAHVLFFTQYHGICFINSIFSQHQQVFFFVAVCSGAVLSEIQRLPGNFYGVIKQHAVKAHDALALSAPEAVYKIMIQKTVLNTYISQSGPHSALISPLVEKASQVSLPASQLQAYVFKLRPVIKPYSGILKIGKPGRQHLQPYQLAFCAFLKIHPQRMSHKTAAFFTRDIHYQRDAAAFAHMHYHLFQKRIFIGVKIIKSERSFYAFLNFIKHGAHIIVVKKLICLCAHSRRKRLLIRHGIFTRNDSFAYIFDAVFRQPLFISGFIQYPSEAYAFGQVIFSGAVLGIKTFGHTQLCMVKIQFIPGEHRKRVHSNLTHQPISISSFIRLFISAAYSSGSSLLTGLAKPLTIMALASASLTPRLII